MFGYYIVAIGIMAIALLLATSIGIELVNEKPKAGALIGETVFMIIALLWAVICIRTISQSKIRTVEKPQIELEITTIVAPDGSIQSDTTYIYKFKK